MNDVPLLKDCRAARMPLPYLTALASLRRLSSVRVVESPLDAWIFWDGEMPSVVRALLPAPRVVLYTPDAGNWRPFGSALPDFTAPISTQAIALDRAILPTTLAPTPPPTALMGKRVVVSIVPSDRPEPVSAVRCSVNAFRNWIDGATSLEIRSLQAAICGGLVWLRGERLPPLPGVERFWGRRVWTLIGQRPNPDWPENVLRSAANIDDAEILVLTATGPEAIPEEALRPVTRSSVRRWRS